MGGFAPLPPTPLPPTPSAKNNDTFSKSNLSGLTTSLQKAIKEGIYYQTSGLTSGKKLEKSNLRNNRPKILTNLTSLHSDSTTVSMNLKNHLKNRVKLRALNTMEAEQNLRKTFSSVQKLIKNNNFEFSIKNLNPNLLNKLMNRTLIPFKFVSNSVNKKLNSVLNSKPAKAVFSPFNSTFNFFIQNKEKNLNSWKQKETVLSTRKKIRRKIYRVLDQKKQIQKTSNVKELEGFTQTQSSEPLRQKQDLLDSFEIQRAMLAQGPTDPRGLRPLQQAKLTRSQKSWNSYENQKLTNGFENLAPTQDPKSPQLGASPSPNAIVSKVKDNLNSKFSSQVFRKFALNIFEKNFKKKRTRSRRYRRFKGRGPIKKHTLAEKLKRQFKLLKRYGEKQEGQDKKMEIFQMITKRKYNPNNAFETRETKQRRTRQSKHRYWKKHKRQQYLQIKRKQRKRRRYAISKLRILNKEFKRIKGNLEIKKWWWQSFLPNFTATTDAYWQLEKNKQIKQELSELSILEILERDSLNNQRTLDSLQIGNQDFKPLALPEALRIRKNLIEKNNLKFGIQDQTETKVISPNLTSLENSNQFNSNQILNSNSSVEDFVLSPTVGLGGLGASPPTPIAVSARETQSQTTSANSLKTEKNIISKLSDNIFNTQNLSVNNLNLNSNLDSKKMISVNPIPFYAGWDETLRQFVVTNRLLSRKDAGYSINLLNNSSINTSIPLNLKSLEKFSTNGILEFTKAPLQGMNAATTLYWQIPFTTYDPDQFFALGMDGFSPLAWRFFNFKHSKQTTKPMLVKNILYKNEKTIENQSLFSYNIQMKMLQTNMKNQSNLWFNSLTYKNNSNSKNQARKIQKRQKRVKKHPRPPVWFPSGPLTNQVLPVHYIYVFYKRSRLPRDRYIGRRLRRSDDPKSHFIQSNFTTMVDFTLRKRVKPIRKYHRKRPLNKNQENGLIVRRRPFKGLENAETRVRPIAKTRLTTQTDILNASLLKTKQRKKTLTNKQTSENLRIRQLRRRIQRQVLRPIWRYKPRSGGFVWPGDYLKLESVKAPILKLNQDFSTTKNLLQSSNLQVRKKKRRNIQEWQIQPKKYLLEKHNLKVLKKRLQKSQNFNKVTETFQKSKKFS